MTTIFFSQRDGSWNPVTLALRNNAPAHVVHAASACSWPVYPRCEYYETLFADEPDCVYYTTDEHMLLVAIWLRREGKLASLTLVSVEGDVRDEYVVDAEGEIDGHVRGGFFTQRPKYLF